MFAVAAAAAQGGIQSWEVLLIIATVVVAFFWRVLIRIGLAAIVIGFAFLMVSGLLEFFHGLRSLIP